MFDIVLYLNEILFMPDWNVDADAGSQPRVLKVITHLLDLILIFVK